MEDDKTNIKIDLTKLLVVPIDQVRPNSWNPKDKDTKEYQDVKASILANGLEGFVIVRENPSGNSLYEILDGEQRWTACKEIGFQKVLIYNMGEVSDKEAQEKTLWHQVQVQFNELSLAKLISGMIDQFGEINTPYDQRKIAEMQELAKFNFDQYKKTSTTPPTMGTSELLRSFMVQVTSSQYDIIMQALAKAKKVAGEGTLDSKALEFVCAEYIAQVEGQ